MVAIIRSINRASCPMCGKVTSNKHCTRIKCPWFVCGSCMTPRKLVVFNKIKQFFVKENMS